MIKSFLLWVALTSTPSDSTEFQSPAQVFEQASAHEANEEYDQAIELYLSISPNDTSYTEALSNLMDAYNDADMPDETITIGDSLKDVKSEFRNGIYIALGNAYLKKDEVQKSREVYLEGLELFPYSYVLLYNTGVTYYRENKYKTAVEYFQRCLKLNPYYSSAHIMTAYISMLQGHRTKAAMGYLMYLTINPDRNSTLVFLNNLLSDAARDEGSIDPIFDNSSFTYYDNLLRSKAALDSRFKYEVDFNAAIVKQCELLLSKLEYVEGTDDFWMDFYVPFFSQLSDQSLRTAYIYYILKSVGNEDIDSWIDKHEKEKNEWVILANASLKRNRQNLKTTILGEEDVYSHWYFSSHALSAIGNQIDDDTRIGPWAFYSSNSQLNAIGRYNEEGDKVGDWKYYYDDGNLSREEFFDEQGQHIKPTRYYHQSGPLSIVVPYTENELDGTLEYYYECGTRKENFPYQKGQKSGKGQFFHESGQLKVDYKMEDGEFENEYTYFYKNGNKNTSYLYEKGVLKGDFISYYMDGQVDEKGSYENDSLSGDWVGYHKNGETSYTGSFKNGKRVGEWIFYHNNGEISSTEFYDETGELHGELMFYDLSGLLKEVQVYDHGKAIGYTFFNTTSDTLSNQYNASGNMPYNSHYHTGEPLAISTLKSGELNGSYENFFKNGSTMKIGTMLDGDFDGYYEEFHSTGQLKLKSNYSEGSLNGYSTWYFKNGQIEQEGWHVNGELEQEWRTYNPDGSLAKVQYYIDGELQGWATNYADNKPHRAFKYDNGTIIAVKEYDTLGNVYREQDLPFGSGERTYQTINGETTFKVPVSCGYFDGGYQSFYPNGKLKTQSTIRENLYHGPYKAYFPNGEIFVEGAYANDDRHGSWKWYYDNGKVASSYTYIRGDIEGLVKRYYVTGQLESVCEYVNDENHGSCKYYDMAGNIQLIKIYSEDEFVAYIKPQTNDTIQFDRKGSFKLETYFSNGPLAAQQSFKNGEFDGAIVYYNKTGTKTEMIEYKDGDRHGKWIRYFPDGTVQEERDYYYGLQHGDEKEYYASGKLKRITPYKNDEKDGLEIRYSANGSILSKIYFRNGDIYY